MVLRVDECQRLLKPENIFELLPRNIFEELIRGLSHWFGRGVVLLWAEMDPDTGKWVVKKENRLEPEKYRPDFSVFCEELRNRLGNEFCFDFDRCVAQEYMDGQRKEAESYACWAKLRELAYPLRYEGNIRAVLLAGGQLIPPNENEKEKVKQAVLEKIQQENRQVTWGELEPFFDQEVAKQRKPNAISLEEGQQRLSDLGKGLQGTIDIIYQHRLVRAMAILQEDLQQVFAHADLSNRDGWWQQIKDAFEDFRQIIGLDEILVLRRRGGHYYRVFGDNSSVVKIGEVIEYIAQDQLQQLESAAKNVFSRALPVIGQQGPWWVFRTEHRSDRVVVSTLILINGQIQQEYAQLVADFCRSAAGFEDMAEMVFQVEDARLCYEQEMGSIAHSFRTPMQNILLELDNLRATFSMTGDWIDEERIQTIMDRVFDTKTDINIILKEESDEIEDVDIPSLLRDMMSELEPQARQKRCTFCERGYWPDRAIVRASRIRLRQAFSDLMDNAVKYSWDAKDIRMGIEIHNACVKTIIENFGLGIPPDKLLEFGQYGIRGEATDLNRPYRTGTGWGLQIATTTVERFGGSLKIGSRSADEDYRGVNEKYHRYITQVQVVLPLKMDASINQSGDHR